MSESAGGVGQRIERLVCCYPRRWRERYGEEFAELLLSDFEERGRSLRRTLDVAANGLVARLSVVGLAGSPFASPQSGLATIGAAIVGFIACGFSLWSQLLVGWQSTPPPGRSVTVAVVVMSIGVGYLCLLALLAAAPVVAEILRSARRPDARPLIRPIIVVITGLAILALGGHYVAGVAPAADGHAWQHQSLVPARLADLARAETLAVSTYWVHPDTLLALPQLQLAWMVASPVALLATLIGAVTVVRRITLPDASLRYEARLAKAALIALVPYLGAAGWWVITSHTGPADVFQAGSLDLMLVACMAAALAVARVATQRIPIRAR